MRHDGGCPALASRRHVGGAVAGAGRVAGPSGDGSVGRLAAAHRPRQHHPGRRSAADRPAIKLTEPFVHDGRLDERVYGDNEPFGDFIQVVPRNGDLASERTDVWITYDDRNIYVSARVHDSAPPEQWVANELRRDTNQMRNNDHIGVTFDTFYDRRSGFMFYTNPLGGFADYSVVDEGSPNTDWNPVWTTRTGRFEGGWTWRWPSRSSRSATPRAPTRCGGSRCGAPSAARTNGPT